MREAKGKHWALLDGDIYNVSTEEELALRSQRLDVLIIELRPASKQRKDHCRAVLSLKKRC